MDSEWFIEEKAFEDGAMTRNKKRVVKQAMNEWRQISRNSQIFINCLRMATLDKTLINQTVEAKESKTTDVLVKTEFRVNNKSTLL